jgi:CubicO group peptidase (beta-lactamase class C family)
MVEPKATTIVMRCFTRRRFDFALTLLTTILGVFSGYGYSSCAADLAREPAPAAPTQALRPGDPREHGFSGTDLGELRAILRDSINNGTVPGVSLLLAHRGEIIFKEAFGNLRVDQEVLMASSAKPVTATLLMILADRKMLALDDPVEKYLPEFKHISVKGKPPVKLPTVRHLLCNMSGLPGDFLVESLLKRLRKGVDKEQRVSPETSNKNGTAGGGLFTSRNGSLAASVRRLAAGGLATEPGAEFHYCTMGFNAAARVAEVAGKRPFEELIYTELLVPMGMNSTRYTPVGLQGLNSSPKLANGESRFIMAGGGMTSTLDDFAAFYQMHLNGGTYGGRCMLSEQGALMMRTRQGKIDLLMAGPYGKDYGLAFFLERLDERARARVITHPGFFGTTPWLDEDRDLVGVLFVESNFLRVMPLVHRLQTKVREIVPVKKRKNEPADGTRSGTRKVREH